MKSDAALKTFVTFRVSGDGLDPERVTELLKIRPTVFRVKGETYSTGRSSITARTGVWMISSDDFIANVRLNDHIRLILSLLALGASPSRGSELFGPSTQDEMFSLGSIFLRLRGLFEADHLTGTMTFFWYGAAGAAYPVVPASLLDFLHDVPIATEMDFDRDEAVRAPRRKAA